MKTKLIITLILVGQFAFAQDPNFKKDLVELAKLYRSFSFRNEPTQDVFNQIKAMKSPELATSKGFVSEIIKSNNLLCTKKFLLKPDSITLKSLYVMRGVNWNLHEAEGKDNLVVVDSLWEENTEYNELVACYYGLLFSAVGNKNRPFDLSEMNFTISGLRPFGAYSVSILVEKPAE